MPPKLRSTSKSSLWTDESQLDYKAVMFTKKFQPDISTGLKDEGEKEKSQHRYGSGAALLISFSLKVMM